MSPHHTYRVGRKFGYIWNTFVIRQFEMQMTKLEYLQKLDDVIYTKHIWYGASSIMDKSCVASVKWTRISVWKSLSSKSCLKSCASSKPFDFQTSIPYFSILSIHNSAGWQKFGWPWFQLGENLVWMQVKLLNSSICNSTHQFTHNNAIFPKSFSMNR